jgi:hypothetical protein
MRVSGTVDAPARRPEPMGPAAVPEPFGCGAGAALHRG